MPGAPSGAVPGEEDGQQPCWWRHLRQTCPRDNFRMNGLIMLNDIVSVMAFVCVLLQGESVTRVLPFFRCAGAEGFTR